MTSGKASNIERFGEHTLEFEPPDLCVVRFGEVITLDVCHAFMHVQNRIMEEHGGIFQIADYARVRSVAPEVRKLSAEIDAPPNLLGSVSFGTSFHVRVLAKLSLALRSIAKRDMNVKYQMVDSEADARALVAQWRREHEQKKGG